MHLGPGQVKEPCYIIRCTPMTSKRDRQNLILEMVRQDRIESQQSLAEALRRHEVNVSQATLSRDIQELGLVKAGNAYIVGTAEIRQTTEQTLRRVLREYVIDVERVVPILVMKTSAGNAQTVAGSLDGVGWPEIVGTIAGDNTIFVLCRSARDLEESLRRIEDLRA